MLFFSRFVPEYRIKYFSFLFFSHIFAIQSILFATFFNRNLFWSSSLIRQKGESQNGCFRYVLSMYVLSMYDLLVCAYQGVRNVRFSENLACFVFLKHPFWDSSFCLITNQLKYWNRDWTRHILAGNRFLNP